MISSAIGQTASNRPTRGPGSRAGRGRRGRGRGRGGTATGPVRGESKTSAPKRPTSETLAVQQVEAEQDSDSSGESNVSFGVTAEFTQDRRPVPREIIEGQYCRFCFDQWATKVHHSREFEHDLLTLETELEAILRQQSRETGNLAALVVAPEMLDRRYDAISWKIERLKELQRAGSKACFNLWIDHLTTSRIIDEHWSYHSTMASLTADWIEDPDVPTLMPKQRARFPPGTAQQGDIEMGADALSEEELLDELDDNDQRAREDDYRLKNMAPVFNLEIDDYEGAGENLGLEAARAALLKMQTGIIPQTIRMWRDTKKPFTHQQSYMQMKDYIKDVHEYKEAGSDNKISMQASRALVNIAFAMQSANQSWKSLGLSDEGYTKLLDDAFGQITELRSHVEAAGVLGLPPIANAVKPTIPRRQKSIEPFVIDHWLDERENVNRHPYRYDPNRPLGPMMSENAHTSHEDCAEVAIDKNGMVNLAQYSGRVSGITMSKEELMGVNMEMDQLVERE